MSNEIDKMLKTLDSLSKNDTASTKKLNIIMNGLKDVDMDTVTEIKVDWEIIKASNGDIEAILPKLVLKKDPIF
jgi:hypothetical protein